jgi:pyridine nucleotide-disulfide oxidoreductase
VTPERADVAVIGAGPYGIACAACLRAAGIDPIVFGKPMEFWRERMPAGMMLRSPRRAAHLADPDGSLSLDEFEAATGRSVPHSVPIEAFIDYALWYQGQVAPDVDQREVLEVLPDSDGFRLRLAEGEEVAVKRVVVAAGLGPFAIRPDPLGKLPSELVSHSADHASFEPFRGQRVLVVGCGQSGLESAALLHEVGADVEVLARAQTPVWLAGKGGFSSRLYARMTPPTDVGGRVSGWLAATPDVLRRVPTGVATWTGKRCMVPAGAGWLIPRLREVNLTMGREVVSAEQRNGGIRVRLDDGSGREADHVVLGTGWRVDVSRYPFLGHELLSRLERNAGYPILRRGMESSIPGLHFVGAPAGMSFGPIMRFVVGTWYAAPVVARAVTGRRQRPLRFSFRPRHGKVRTD